MNHSQFTLDLWRTSNTFLRSLCTLIIVCYLSVFYSPSVQAITQHKLPERVTYNATEQLMIDLQALQQSTQKYLHYSQDKSKQTQAFEIYQRSAGRFDEKLAKQRKAAEKSMREELNRAVKQNDKAAIKLHSKLLTALLSNYRDIDQQLKIIQQANFNDDAPIIEAAVELNQMLAAIKFGKEHHEFDSESMPFGPSSSTVAKPAQNLTELLSRLGEQQEVQSLAQTKSTTQALSTEADTSSTDTENYLTFNIDNTPSPKLNNLAASLNHDPVQIYQYVYNNIEYIPAHGSIQGADYTSQSLKGGAIDQANLLVALLRISNVPARYVYGSINVDIEQAMNWVGGVRDVNAAQNILGQGGVPNTLIGNQHGEISQINLEHVWVEANIDNQWQAIDPSFKQYQYAQGINLEEVVELDEASIVNNITQGATINNEGWVQNIDQAAIATELSSVQSQIEDYISQQYPDATVADVLGSKTIIANEQVELPSSLPYLSIVASQPLKDLPDDLRHKFGFDLQNEFGSTMLTVERSLPELAGKRLALSFTPSTEADEQALLSYLPDTVKSENDLPSELPYGAFNVTANITLNEEIITSSQSSFAFGEELKGHKGFWDPRFGWSKKTSVLNAGDYQAIGIDYHGVSVDALTEIKNMVEATKSAIEAETLDSLTSHNTTGAIMQAGIHSYFVATQAQNQLQAAAADVINYRQPSYGTFGTSLNVSYFFGVPQKVGFLGVVMDVDRLADNSESITNCWNTWSEYNRQSGAMASYYENLVPEQLFSTENEQLDGISAVKALAVASAQGQKIYTINGGNAHLLNEVTAEQNIKNEIQQALVSGKEVTIHQQPINEFGWTGTGYVIVDPETGAGAYKISGGGNGGFLDYEGAILLGWGGFVAGLIGGAIFSFIAIAIAAILLFNSYLDIRNGDLCGGGISALVGLGALVGLMGLLALGAALFPVFIAGIIITGATSVVGNKFCK